MEGMIEFVNSRDKGGIVNYQIQMMEIRNPKVKMVTCGSRSPGLLYEGMMKRVIDNALSRSKNAKPW